MNKARLAALIKALAVVATLVTAGAAMLEAVDPKVAAAVGALGTLMFSVTRAIPEQWYADK